MDLTSYAFSKKYVDFNLKNEILPNLNNDINVGFFREDDKNTSYQITRINKKTINGGEIRPKVKLTGESITDTNTTDTREFMNNNEYLFAINGGFFDTSTKLADGTVIVNGEVLQGTDTVIHQGQYSLGIKTDGTLKAYENEVSAQEILNDGSENAVMGFIPIVENGEIVTNEVFDICLNSYEKHPRQIIGQTKTGDYIILTCDGRTDNEDGLTLPDCAEILKRNAVDFAYNLDGGGSTQTVFYKKQINRLLQERNIPTVIVFDAI